MKSVFTEKKTIAWFTLAECVSRGERERAFGVYRLLSHSLDDRALALQLEADLLCAFNMQSEALEKYEKAMRVYKQSGKLLEAAAICEHMRLLAPETIDYDQQALALYSMLQFEDRAAELLVSLVAKLISEGAYDAACNLASSVQELNSYGKQGHCFERVVACLSQMEHIPLHVRVFYAQKTVHAYIEHGSQEPLKQFLATLSMRDQEVYAAAIKLLKDNHV